MATANPVPGLQGRLGVAKKITGWYIAAAVLFIVLGIFAIIEPGVASLGVTLLVGWLLIIGAAGHLIAAFKGGGAKQVIFQLLIAVVYFIGGIYFLTHPILAVSTLTLLLAGVILAEGVLEIISYFRMKGEGAWGWVLFNGIVTILLACLIWFQWPSSTVWAIGILVGVNLLMTGMTRLMFGLAVRKVIPQTAR
ncbi:MAG TPA: HdeD family acid-resistance protein [Candidatus Acidoferrum sp.]|nr:HdeD family acid-resistance protein [Candidatus Acidoferrum sp.]